jgi:hypothetical protein
MRGSVAHPIKCDIHSRRRLEASAISVRPAMGATDSVLQRIESVVAHRVPSGAIPPLNRSELKRH